MVLVFSMPVAAASPTRSATALRVDHAEGSAVTEVVVAFSEPPTFTARLTNGQRRLIIDVPDSGVDGAPPAIVEANGVVAGVMLQQFDSKRTSTTRAIITLSDAAEHSVAVVGNELRVRFATKKGQLAALPSSPAGETTESSTPARGFVQDVAYSRHGDEDRITIDLGGSAKVTPRRVSPTMTRLELQGMQLPRELEQAFDTRAFSGAVSLISCYRQGADAVRIDVEHSKQATHRVERRGDAVVWSFFEGAVPSSISGVAQDGKVARKTQTIFTDTDARNDEGVPQLISATEIKHFSSDQAAAFAPQILGQTPGRYSGRRIDLDFKDADVHNVLRLLADTGRVNIVAADNVSGSVTLRMRNVPWDQALEVVLRAKNLGMDQRGNIIRVAPQADLEKEREMAIARRQQELQLAPLETRLIPVSYAEAEEVQARAADLLSSRGTIAVDERTNVMIVRDVAGNLDQIEELTRSLDTQTPQVLIEARIVEATSRYLRDVGIQWGGDASFSAATGNPTGLAFPSNVGLAGGATDSQTPTAGLSPFSRTVENPNFAVNLPAAVGTGAGGALGLTFGSVDSNFNLSLRLSAAETSGMLRILSSPRVLTLDNSTARISQGTLIPFSQVSAQGVQTTFQEAKLQLLVEPHVTADGSVSMHVKINRDEPDFNQTSPRGDPTILKREAETDLLVMDGHTAVIGGIFTRNTGRNVDQVPFFGDIPLLGLLFQKRTASDTRGELVIFLTPRIVNRAQALGR
jgi:type IV pilus assembly protein PilQ